MSSRDEERRAVRPGLRTEVLETWAAIRPLEAEWNALLHRSRADSVFLSWEWVSAWAEVNPAGLVPFVVVARDDRGDLVGVAPFYRASFRLLGVLPFRGLRVFGDRATGAEYLDWIVREDLEDASCRAIASALAARGGSWEFVWMPNLAAWNGLAERVIEACRHEGLYARQRPREFGIVDLPSDFATYLASLSANARSTWRRRLKHFVQQGVSFERCDSAEELPLYLEALFHLNHQRWRAAGRDGNFVRNPGLAEFYRRLAPVALERGWLRMYVARLGKEVMAVQYGYVYRGTYFQIQEGFDPKASGIGTALRGKVFEECVAEGVAIYDFMEGFTEHKRRWGSKRRVGCDAFIAGGSLRSTLVKGVALWPTGRFLRPEATPPRGLPSAARGRTPILTKGHPPHIIVR